MTLPKMIAQTFYSCMATIGFLLPSLTHAQVAQKPKLQPSLPRLEISQPRDLRMQKEELILINKDLKKNLGLLRPQGPRTGGGGNSCALAIAKNTQTLEKQLEAFGSDIMTYDSLPKLATAIAEASFFVSKSLIKDGQSKDAMNFPHENKIVLTEHFCRYEMTEVSARAMSLLLHEYLGLAGIDDRQYQISGRFLEMYSEIVNQRSEIQYYLQKEAEKDLAGTASCFKGEVKKKSLEMEESYGGRYQPDVTIDTANAGYSVYRFRAKYCSEASEGKRTCDNTDSHSYLVTAQFTAATSGSAEAEAIAFNVRRDVRTVLVVKEDADYNPNEDEIISEKTTTTYTCTPLEPQLKPIY